MKRASAAVARYMIAVSTAIVGFVGLSDTLSESDIAQAAAGFLKTDRVGSRVLAGRTVRSVVARGNLWLIRLAPSGYIVFAGSDQAEPVPFFSTRDFVEPAEGTAFAAVLEGADSACARLEATALARNALKRTSASLATDSSEVLLERRQSRWAALLGNAKPQLLLNALSDVSASDVVVSPFLSAHWNQCQPYNDYAPVYTNGSDSGWYRGRTPCGCVATAAAQTLHYWQWPVRMDAVRQVEHAFAPDGAAAGYGAFVTRFNGCEPFDWTKLTDSYSLTGGDFRGLVAESVRHPVARLVMLCDSLATMQYAPGGSSAYFGDIRDNAPWYQGGEKLILQDKSGGSFASDWATKVARMRANVADGIPVPVSIPGHAIVGHGWAESGDTKYIYLNYGWGGSNDGYYNLDDSSSTKCIWRAFVDFKPRPMVQLDPLPKVSATSVRLDWHLPPCYASSVQGFTIQQSAPSSTVGDMSEDFETTDACGSFELTTDSAYSDSRFLHISPLAAGQCPLGDECILTTRSVLTYDVRSGLALGQSVKIQAQFDGGEWTTLSAPALNASRSGTAWRSMRVFLGDHGGQTASFRVVMTRTGYSYYPSGFGTGIDNFSVSDVMRYTSAKSTSVASTARSCTLSGLTAGACHRFTVTPLFADGSGETDNASTIAAGVRRMPLPGTETLGVGNLAYLADAADGVWFVEGVNGTVTGDASFRLGRFDGMFSVRIDGALTATSALAFSYETSGFYSSGSSYDTLTARFVSAETGEATELWQKTVTENMSKTAVTISLGTHAGKRGEVQVTYHHGGSQYYGSTHGAVFHAPVVTDVQLPQSLPALAWQTETVTALGVPTIDVHCDEPAFAEGFYRENALGTNVFYVTCSPSVVSLTASPSHVTLLPDDKVSVVARGSGEFAVIVDASQVPARYSRSRMILTLAACDANGTTVYKDLSMRFSDETQPQVYASVGTTVGSVSKTGQCSGLGGSYYAVELSSGKTFLVSESELKAAGIDVSGGVTAALLNGTGRNGIPRFASYLFGLDANSDTPASEQFRANISFDANGLPVIDCTPKTGSDFVTYTTLGKTALTDAAWTKVTDANRAKMKFFKVRADIK